MLLLLPWLSAQAHVGDLINGIDLAPAAGDELPTVEASYGLLLPGDDGWRWVCHEAVTAPGAVRSPRYAQGPEGAWLAWIADPTQGRGGRTLFRSDDACAWGDVVLPGEGVVTAAAWTGPQTAVAVTKAPGAVLSSVDGGRTFAEVLPPDPEVEMTSVVAAGGAVWVAGIDVDGRRARLWVDEDGAGLVEREVPLPATVEPPIPSARLVAADGPSAVLVLDPSGADTALRTDDGGRTWSVVYEAAGAIVDGALDGDATWLVLDGIRLVRVDADGAAADQPEFPRSIGIATDGAGALWAVPQSSLVRSMLSRSTDGGATFETVAHPDDIVGPRACPAESEGSTVCEPLWDTLLPRIRGFDDPPVDTAGDTGTPATPTAPDPPRGDGSEGCGCGGGGVGAAGLAAGLAALAARRRR